MYKMLETLKERWTARTPIIFSKIIRFAMSISCVAIAIQTALVTAGAEIPEWWGIVFPYMVGAGAGASAVAKLTQQYDKDGNPIKNRGKRQK